MFFSPHTQLQSTKDRARMELSACKIQGTVRRYQAVLLAASLLKVRDERRARAVAEDVSCRVIQRVGRGRLGRKKVQEKIDYWKVSHFVYLSLFSVFFFRFILNFIKIIVTLLSTLHRCGRDMNRSICTPNIISLLSRIIYQLC